MIHSESVILQELERASESLAQVQAILDDNAEVRLTPREHTSVARIVQAMSTLHITSQMRKLNGKAP
jgi:hypothetical protein